MAANSVVFFTKMRQLSTCFLSVVFARAVWSVIQAASGLSQPHSVSSMFGSWLCGLSKELKSLALLGAAATCRSLWLCRNDLVFENKRTSSPLQVIYSIIHLLRKWATYRSQLHKISLPEAGSLPSAKWFAECCFSGTRQRRLC